MSYRLLSCVLLCLIFSAEVAGGERPHTVGATVATYIPPLKLPATGGARRIRVYLPPDYAGSARRYPVLYMFDGQNLFDDATSYAGEWGVDETLDVLARQDQFSAIVVGIDHGGEERFHELIPYWNVHFLPNRGEAFASDVAHAIKPYIDTNYRTLTGREHTAIIGSSLGGLEASYAVHRYPELFGRAGVFSPSYWVSDEAFSHAEDTPLPEGTRVYLYMGGREGEESVAQVERMALALRPYVGEDNVRVSVAPDAEHNESAWRAEFPFAVRWLFELPSVPANAGPVSR